jgi:hypothetical protein
MSAVAGVTLPDGSGERTASMACAELLLIECGVMPRSEQKQKAFPLRSKFKISKFQKDAHSCRFHCSFQKDNKPEIVPVWIELNVSADMFPATFRVISYKANTMKSNSTLKEFELLAQNWRKLCESGS